MTRAAQLVAPQQSVVFPAWQGMAHMRDMFSGQARFDGLDNDRFPDVQWTSVRQRFADGHLPGGMS